MADNPEEIVFIQMDINSLSPVFQTEKSRLIIAFNHYIMLYNQKDHILVNYVNRMNYLVLIFFTLSVIFSIQ